MTGDRRDLAARIMDLAVRKPPADREDWAMAMRAEFDMLGEARLIWAVGCLVAATRWRARGEAAYAAALAAGAAFAGGLAPLVYLGVVFTGLASRSDMAGIVMPLIVVAPVLAGFAVALKWPGRRLATALAMGMGPSLLANAVLLIGGVGLRPLNRQMLLGWAALVILAYVGALAGSALGRRRTARITRS